MDLLIEQLSKDFNALSFGVFAVLLLTELLKKSFPEVNARYFSIGLSILSGLIYALLTTFVPIEILKSLSAFGILVFSFATGVYKLQK